MKKNSFITSLPVKLLAAVITGILLGQLLGTTDGSVITASVLNIVVTLKFILIQIFILCYPLLIIAFIARSLTQIF